MIVSLPIRAYYRDSLRRRPMLRAVLGYGASRHPSLRLRRYGARLLDILELPLPLGDGARKLWRLLWICQSSAR
jgi:hypothetical protein